MSLYVNTTGTPDAPSIVFLHGVGTSGWMWQKQIAGLTDFHCLNVDLPGHGKSNHATWVSLADTADQIATIIQTRATNERAHVVGLSLGGHVALLLLEHHADVLDHVVISGVTASPMPNRALLPLQLWLMSRLMKGRRFAERQAESMYVPPEMRAAFTENLAAMSMQAYRGIWKEVAHYQVPASLRSVHVPTLITAGSRESDIIIQAVRRIAHMMPDSQGCLAPGVGHGWNIEDSDLFNEIVRAWITDTSMPSRLQVMNDGDSTRR